MRHFQAFNSLYRRNLTKKNDFDLSRISRRKYLIYNSSLFVSLKLKVTKVTMVINKNLVLHQKPWKVIEGRKGFCSSGQTWLSCSVYSSLLLGQRCIRTYNIRSKALVAIDSGPSINYNVTKRGEGAREVLWGKGWDCTHFKWYLCFV